jgi:FMN phosphatase YigB (HAD superfamily)
VLSKGARVAFLIDVDNTLLDNDRFSADLDAKLAQSLGAEGQTRYREAYESLRKQRGYADYLSPLEEMRSTFDGDPDLLDLAQFMLDYPFADNAYPGMGETLMHLSTLGLTTILSDGDLVLQPRKIKRSGLWDAVQGRVLIYLHKELRLDAMQERFPAEHYVVVDDKPRVLAAIKTALGAKVTTIFVRQGHYATQAGVDALQPPPDLHFDHIADLLTLTIEQLQPPAIAVATFKEIP